MDDRLAPFDVVRQEVAVGALSLTVARPRSAEDLIDEDEYARDERLPYWAELWPSAHVLAGGAGGPRSPGARVVELGCGVGLPGDRRRPARAPTCSPPTGTRTRSASPAPTPRRPAPASRRVLVDWTAPPADCSPRARPTS